MYWYTFSKKLRNKFTLNSVYIFINIVSYTTENNNSGVGQGVLLTHNKSNRFDCRFVTAKVYNSPSIMMKEMEGTTFGIWSAHGEGRYLFTGCGIVGKCFSQIYIALVSTYLFLCLKKNQSCVINEGSFGNIAVKDLRLNSGTNSNLVLSCTIIEETLTKRTRLSYLFHKHP